jgi:hypothetical protein
MPSHKVGWRRKFIVSGVDVWVRVGKPARRRRRVPAYNDYNKSEMRSGV